MPLQFKAPGYLGNALLLLLSLVIVFSDSVVIGVLLGALALLNLYLVYKLDRFSSDSGWLAHELEVARTREQLLEAQKRIAELEAGAASHS
jgi:hypothetical protein